MGRKRKNLKLEDFDVEVVSSDSAFSEKQHLALNEDWVPEEIDEICYDGGARSGKTYLVILAIISRAWLIPESRHLVARYRLNHLKMSLWRQTLIPILKKNGFREGIDYTINESDLIITFANGSEIYGAGLDDADRVEKIMGTEFNTIFINEATQISYATYQKVSSRLSLNIPSIINKMIIDCNPRNKYHWIYKYFILRQDPESGNALSERRMKRIARRNWTPLDNPYLSKEYVERLSDLTGAEKERLYKGLWVDVEGLVYPMFEQAIVEDFPIPESWDCAGAVDFGYTNPFVFLWFFYDKSNETWYLAKEHYEAEKTVREHCKLIKEFRIPNTFTVADWDAEDRATMAENGITTIQADKDISTGLQAVMQLLSNQKGLKLKIFRSCVKTIEEFSVYSWEPTKEGKNSKEHPVKSFDHAMDAIRYFANKVLGKKFNIITRDLEKVRAEESKRKKPMSADDVRANRLRMMGVDPGYFTKKR